MNHPQPHQQQMTQFYRLLRIDIEKSSKNNKLTFFDPSLSHVDHTQLYTFHNRLLADYSDLHNKYSQLLHIYHHHRPSPFLCSLTGSELSDPVVCPHTGRTYNRSSLSGLKNWPHSIENKIDFDHLIPNHALRNLISLKEWQLLPLPVQDLYNQATNYASQERFQYLASTSFKLPTFVISLIVPETVLIDSVSKLIIRKFSEFFSTIRSKLPSCMQTEEYYNSILDQFLVQSHVSFFDSQTVVCREKLNNVEAILPTVDGGNARVLMLFNCVFFNNI